MPPVFIILYALVLLTTLFAVMFLVLRYFGMTEKQAAIALVLCLAASFIINLAIDFSFRGIGFIR